MPTYEVNSPDGQTLEYTVPDGVTSDQVLAHAQQNYTPKQDAVPTAEQPGILDNIGNDLSNRWQNVQGLANDYNAGTKNLPEATYETMGEGGNAIGDIASEALKSYIGMIPGGQPVIDAAKNEFANTEVGKTLSAAGQEYQQLPKRARDLISATGGIANAVAAYGPLKSAGSAGIDAVDSGLDGAMQTPEFTPDEKFPITQDQARNLGGGLFQQAKEQGAVLGPQFTDGKLIPAANSLLPKGEVGQIVGGDTPFAKFVQDKIQPLAGKQLDFDDLKTIDEGLGEAIDDHTENGLPKKSAYPFMQLQGQVRQMVKPGLIGADDLVNGTPEAFDTWNKAQGVWSDSYKLGDLERIEQKAQFSQTPSQARQNGFKTLALNRAKMNLYSPDEQALINQAAQGSTTNDLLRVVGSRLGSVAAFGAAGGGVPGAIAGAAVYPVSKGARTLADWLQSRPGAELGQNISNNILDRFPDYSAPSAPQPGAPLALPAPSPEFSADSFGNVQQMTPDQQIAAHLARQKAIQMGMTPDVTANIARQAARAKTAPILDALEAQIPQPPPGAGAIPTPPNAGMRLQSLLNAHNVAENPNNSSIAQALMKAAKLKGAH